MESDLSKHDDSTLDPVCKRMNKKGKQCTSTPTFPARLCIKHKAKLDWDREKQRQKLEAELSGKDTVSRFRQQSAESLSLSGHETLYPSLSQTTTLVENDQIARSMWGEVELFATAELHSTGMNFHQADSKPDDTKDSSWRTCVILSMVSAGAVLTSLSLALWWSMTRNDVSGGFTIGGYIVAVGCLVLYPIQYQHSKSCRCWHKLQRSRTM